MGDLDADNRRIGDIDIGFYTVLFRTCEKYIAENQNKAFDKKIHEKPKRFKNWREAIRTGPLRIEENQQKNFIRVVCLWNSSLIPIGESVVNLGISRIFSKCLTK